jgi:cell division septation protein DedD
MDERNIVIERSLSGRKRARFGGRVASQFQVALGLLGVLVCLAVVFGIGFLFGLWYQANEPIMPHDDAVSLAEEQLKQTALPPPQPEMTFYSTLTTPDVSEMPPAADASRAASEPLPQAPEPSWRAMDGQGLAEGPGETTAADLQPPAPVAAMPPEVGKPDSTPPVTPALEAASQPTSTGAPPTSSASEYYSVQVGSFRLAEQAQRLQQQLVEKGYAARMLLTLVPGKGAWYRVRVGKFGVREEADQTAQHLRSRESMDVLVMKESS